MVQPPHCLPFPPVPFPALRRPPAPFIPLSLPCLPGHSLSCSPPLTLWPPAHLTALSSSHFCLLLLSLAPVVVPQFAFVLDRALWGLAAGLLAAFTACPALPYPVGNS